MATEKLIVKPVTSMNGDHILGEYVEVTGNIPYYPTPYTGEEIEEGIMRVIRANLDSFGWLWVNGQTVNDLKDERTRMLPDITLDLNLLRVPGSFVIYSYTNYVPGMDLKPINIFNEYYGDRLFMVTLIGTDIYYRTYDENTDIWTPWVHQSFCEVITSDTPPIEFDSNDLWLQPPDQYRSNYILYAYIDGEWRDITASRLMHADIYDPNRIQTDIYDYIEALIKKNLCFITEKGATKLPYIYMSEYFLKIAFVQITEEFIYFFVNPRDIKANDILESGYFYVLRYPIHNRIIDETQPVLFKGLEFNIEFLIYTSHNRFYIVNDLGRIYDSENAENWIHIRNLEQSKDIQTIYRHRVIPMSSLNTADEEKAYDYISIRYVEMCDNQCVYFFSTNGDILVETSDHFFLLYEKSDIPEDFKIMDIKIYHGVIYAVGYNADGTPDTRYFKSYDDGNSWVQYELPVSRKWSHIYYSEALLTERGIVRTVNGYFIVEMNRKTIEQIMEMRRGFSALIVTTDEEDTELDSQTYYTQYIKDQLDDIWEPYEYNLGGKKILNGERIPISFEITEIGEPIITIMNFESTSVYQTTYNFLQRYLYLEMSAYTYDELKQIVTKVMESFMTVTYPEYKYRVQIDSFQQIDNSQYGFIFENTDGTLGLQGTGYMTYIDGVYDHINDWNRHMTAEDRAVLENSITKDEFNTIKSSFDSEIDQFMKDELNKLVYTDKFKEVNEIVDNYLLHKSDSNRHVDKAQRDIFNAKEEGDHSHILDERVSLKTSNIEGVLPISTIPLEAFRRMKKVETMEDMFALNKETNNIYNGTCIRVMKPEIRFNDLGKYSHRELSKYTYDQLGELFIDPKIPLMGRFFWVVDDENLDISDGYIEFTMTDTVCVYYDEIIDAPDTRDGLGILDVPTNEELSNELTLHDKSGYGYEMLAAESVEAKMLQQVRIQSAKDILFNYAIENPSNGLCDNLSDMIEYIDTNLESIQKLDIGRLPLSASDAFFRGIYDIQYSPITKRYYIYVLNHMSDSDEISYETIGSPMNNETEIITYTKDFEFIRNKKHQGSPKVPYYTQKIIGIYPTIELYIDENESYLYDDYLQVKVELPEDITIIERHTIIEIKHIIQDSKLYVFVNNNLRLGMLKIWDDMSYEYRLFSAPINSNNKTIVLSMDYQLSDDILTICTQNYLSGKDWMTYRYTDFSVILKSIDYFNSADEYIHGSGKNPATIAIGKITERTTYMPSDFGGTFVPIRYYGKFSKKHIFLVTKITDVSHHYLAITDEFTDIEYVDLETDSINECGILLNVDVIPYGGKTFAIVWQSLSFIENMRIPYIPGDASLHYQQLLLDSDKIIAIDINTKDVIDITNRREISKKSIPHVYGAYGIRYCNGAMYLFGLESLLIQFSPKAFFNMNESEERIYILSTKSKEMQNNYHHSLPIAISDIGEYEYGIYYNGSGYGLNIQLINNVIGHNVANTPIEYQVHKSGSYATKIIKIGVNGVAICQLLSLNATTIIFKLLYKDSLKEKVYDKLIFPNLNSIQNNELLFGGYQPFDIYGNKINNILSFTIAILDINNTETYINLYYIKENNTYTTSRISVELRFIGEKPFNPCVSFSIVKGFLLVSTRPGDYLLYKVEANGIVQQDPIFRHTISEGLQNIPSTRIQFPPVGILNETESEMVVTSDNFVDSEDDAFGYIITAEINEDEDGVIISALCEIPKYIEELFGSDLEFRIFRIPYTLDRYQLVCATYSKNSNKICLFSIANSNDYKVIEFNGFDKIYSIGYLLSTNSNSNEEDYGFLIIEASIKNKNERVSFINKYGEEFQLNYSDSGLYYIPLSSSSIMDTFYSNFSQLQESSSSIYAKIEDRINSLEDLF